MRGIPPEIRGWCFPHFTCATDTENIKKIFEDVKNNVIQANVDRVYLNRAAKHYM